MANMIWKYEALIREFQLVYGKSILARMQTRVNKKGKYIVVILISGIYFGQKCQNALQKKKHEWVAYRKKLPDRGSSETYIQRKKEDVIRFIQAREKEA